MSRIIGRAFSRAKLRFPSGLWDPLNGCFRSGSFERISMTKSRKKPLLFLFLMLAAAVLVIGCFDLQISEAMYKEGSSSGSFFEVSGEPPSIILFSFCVNVLFVCRKTLWEKILDYAWGIGGLTYLAHKLAGDLLPHPEAVSFWHCLAAGVLVETVCAVAFTLVLRRRHPGYFEKGERDESLNWLCNTCAKAAIACILTLFFAFFFKALWGRVRYRDVLAGKGLFSYVAVPHFFSGHVSFPSGHTANAAVFMAVSYFVKNKTGRYLLRAALSVWLLLVGLSRVRYGAHFLTDVIAGATVGLSCFAFAPRILEKIHQGLKDIRLARTIK